MISLKLPFSQELCEEVIKLGKAGKSWTQIAAHYDVDRKTMYNMRKQYPEFNEAMETSKTNFIAYWEDVGQKGIKGISLKFNAPAWMYYMKVSGGDEWREVTEQKISLSDEVKKLSDKDLDEKIRSLEETRIARQLQKNQ